MLKLLNLVEQGSNIQGWVVDISSNHNTNPPSRNYSVRLNGSDSNIGIALHRNDYLDLTTAQGVDQRVPTGIISIKTRNDKYKPIVTKVEDPNDDTFIVLFNYETHIGEVITDVKLENLEVISYYIGKKDHRMRVTMSAVAPDKAKDSSISVLYGITGGNVITTKKVIYPKQPTKQSMELVTEHCKITNTIESREIILPRFDLSKVCVNNGSRRDLNTDKPTDRLLGKYSRR